MKILPLPCSINSTTDLTLIDGLRPTKNPAGIACTSLAALHPFPCLLLKCPLSTCRRSVNLYCLKVNNVQANNNLAGEWTSILNGLFKDNEIQTGFN